MFGTSSSPPGTGTRLSSAPQGAAGLATRGRAAGRGSDADAQGPDLESDTSDAAQDKGPNKTVAVKPLTGVALKFKAKPKDVPVPAATAGRPRPSMIKATRDLLLYYCEECGTSWHVDPDDVEAGMAHPEHYSDWNGDDPEYDLPRTSHRVLVAFADAIPTPDQMAWVGTCFGSRSPYCENHHLLTLKGNYTLPEATAAAMVMRRVMTDIAARCSRDVVEPPRHLPVASAPSPCNMKLVIVSHSRQLVLSLSELMPMYTWDYELNAYFDRHGMPMMHSRAIRIVVRYIEKLATLGVQVQFCLAPHPPTHMAGQFDIDMRFVESDRPALPAPPTGDIGAIIAENERVGAELIARALVQQTEPLMEQLLMEETEALAHLDLATQD